jgi:multidrug resistance efflux pump
VWFELRWGIVACLMLTVALITVIFYNRPSTTNVTLFFRSVPIVPETIGCVAEVNVGFSDQVAAGAPISTLASAGRVERFSLRVGDIVNPMMRSAGTMDLTDSGAGAADQDTRVQRALTRSASNRGIRVRRRPAHVNTWPRIASPSTEIVVTYRTITL